MRNRADSCRHVRRVWQISTTEHTYGRTHEISSTVVWVGRINDGQAGLHGQPVSKIRSKFDFDASRVSSWNIKNLKGETVKGVQLKVVNILIEKRNIKPEPVIKKGGFPSDFDRFDFLRLKSGSVRVGAYS